MTEKELFEAELTRQQGINPSLRGWSEGDEECPVPVPEGDAWEEAKKSWNQPADAAKRSVSYDEQFMEFPLYYQHQGARHVVRERRYRQIKFAATLTNDSVPLVLMTKDFKVIAARNIWKLLWAYLKSKFPKKRTRRKPSLPQYK